MSSYSDYYNFDSVILLSIIIKSFNKCNPVNFFRNNSRVYSGKIGRKLLMALGSHYKNIPCAMWLLMKRFSDLHALGLFDGCLKINAKRRLKTVRAKSTCSLSEGFSRVSRWVLGIFSFTIAAKCRRYQFNLRSVWSLTIGSWCLHQSLRLFPQ